jgi:hypothetical protein
VRPLKKPELLGLIPTFKGGGSQLTELELQKLRDEWNRLYLSFQLPLDLKLSEAIFLRLFRV